MSNYKETVSGFILNGKTKGSNEVITFEGFDTRGDLGNGLTFYKTGATDVASQTPTQLNSNNSFTDSEGFVYELKAGSLLQYDGTNDWFVGLGGLGYGIYIFNTEGWDIIKIKNKYTVLSTGQSNMVGSSNVIEGSTTTNSKLQAWNARFSEGTGDAFILAELRNTPFNSGGQQHIGFNAGKYLAEHYALDIDLINMADGGQPIEKWLADGADPYMWVAIDANCSAAYALTGNKIDVVMWHQGEADQGQDPFDYVDDFLSFKSQVEAAEWSSDSVRFIVGGLASGLATDGSSGARPQMNLAFSLLSETQPNITSVYTGDLEVDSTGVHFTDLSIIQIGHRFGEALLNPRVAVVQPTRYVESSTNITYTADNGRYESFNDFLNLLSTFQFKAGARLDITMPEGEYEINPQRLGFNSSRLNFKGVLSGGFTAVADTDFTGVPADDLTMLKSKYLTVLNVTSGNSFFIVSGFMCGYWQDMLLTHTTPAFKSSFIRGSDPSLNTLGSGAITFENVAMHGASGNTCTALSIDSGMYVEALNCAVSHCDYGSLTNTSQLNVKGSIMAYVAKPVNATNRSFVNAYDLRLTGTTGTSYTASLGSFVDARIADDKANSTISSGGTVQA